MRDGNKLANANLMVQKNQKITRIATKFWMYAGQVIVSAGRIKLGRAVYMVPVIGVTMTLEYLIAMMPAS